MLTVTQTHDHTCVSLQQVKAHLRLDHSEDDDYLLHLIQVATNWVEDTVNSPLLVTSYLWQQSLSSARNFNAKPLISNQISLVLPKQNVTDIKSVVLVGGGGARRAIAYKLREHLGQHIIHIAEVGEALEIEFTAGFGERPNCVPAILRQALINHVTCHYESRSGISRDDYLELLRMVQPYRRIGLI
ncbi:head-tail connector protein [Candidatus Odyssella thessalonicensis]|uniref:head-tail connector protein n=1 Tax=Candidatus Odyssella thessalonicensis TaxID=84647 RepID=UPI000225C133|nr:head-tail connector protein [Candidatus Odyssella thessalonicensis]